MTIHDYILEQESGMSIPITLEDGWNWNFKEHLRRSFLYKNSQFYENNENRKKRPFKNIIKPILNIQYRTEGFDVKDIDIYVDNAETYYKSLLVRKYHNKWALENKIDTFIDELVESYVDYGLALVKNVNSKRPEVVNLRTIAFCDQSDVLSGAFALKHYYSASQLLSMESVGWGKAENGANVSIEHLVRIAEYYKKLNQTNNPSKTPSPYIEIYEVHNCTEHDYYNESTDVTPRMFIVGFYQDEKGQKHGVTLYTKEEKKLPFKAIKRDSISGRACGTGGIEELFEPQTWTNYTEIKHLNMLELASLTLFLSTDPKFKGQNLTNRQTGSVLDLTQGTDVKQMDTAPRNFNQFTDKNERWESHAQRIGAASEALQGEAPQSGTPFKLYEAQIIENKSLHKFRQGQIATFVEEIYREWIMPTLARDLIKGGKLNVELTSDEMIQIAEQLAQHGVNQIVMDKLFKLIPITQEEAMLLLEEAKAEQIKQGRKRFLEILKGEFEDEKLNVYTNIAGKQKNLSLLTDKMVSVVRQLLATPQLRQDRELISWLNSILETSGISPLMVSSSPQPQQQPQQGGPTEPLKDLTQNNERGTQG